MKICFLAPASSMHSHRWIKYFAENGHEVSWVSFHRTILPPPRGVNYHELIPLDEKNIGILLLLPRLKRLLRLFNPEIVHAHYVGTYGFFGALSGFQPIVSSAWGSDILFAGKSWYKGPLVKYALNRSRIITTDAYHMIDAMKAMGVEESKLKLIYFGVDTRQFQPLMEKRQAIRQHLKLPHEPIVISLRHLEPLYDVETLVRASSIIIHEVPDAKIIIIGSGPQESFLQQLATDLQLGESIRFLGRIPNAQLPDYLSAADLYVSTSLSDAGIAASTAEAMACGLPVVVSDSGENRNWIRDGENGYVVPTHNPNALAKCIITLLKNQPLCKQLGSAGRQTIEQRNNYYSEMAKMENIYKELCLPDNQSG